MTPRVEGLEINPYVGYHRYFLVDLSQPEVTDINLFDLQAKTLGNNSRLIFLRFLAVHREQRDEMYVVPLDISHWQIYERLNEQTPCNPLSAGLIKLTYIGDRIKRELYDHSPTLELSGILTRKKSDEYKQNQLKEKLSPSFIIS